MFVFIVSNGYVYSWLTMPANPPERIWAHVAAVSLFCLKIRVSVMWQLPQYNDDPIDYFSIVIGCPVYSLRMPCSFSFFMIQQILLVEPSSAQWCTWLWILEYSIGVQMKEQTAPDVRPASMRHTALGECYFSIPIHYLYFIRDRQNDSNSRAVMAPENRQIVEAPLYSPLSPIQEYISRMEGK